MPSEPLTLSPIDSCVEPCTALSFERPTLSPNDCAFVLLESGCASRAILSVVPVSDSLALSSVDLDESGVWGVVSWGWLVGGGGADHLLAGLGVEVFAEGVGHGCRWLFGWVGLGLFEVDWWIR